jgi:hypothetical protein
MVSTIFFNFQLFYFLSRIIPKYWNEQTLLLITCILYMNIWVGSVLLIFLVFYVVFFSLFVFVLCFVYPMLPLSLDCSFLIAPLVFSNVYFLTECILPFSSIAKKRNSKNCRTRSEQVKNDLFERGCRWFQLFSLIFSCFIFYPESSLIWFSLMFIF